MPTLPPPDPRQANREEAAAALVAFGREVFGGGLRWLATVFIAGVNWRSHARRRLRA